MYICIYIYIYIYLIIFFSTKSIWNTEIKSSQILNYTQVTNEDAKPILDHIIWQINCANLWLFSTQIQDVAVPKETWKFSERSPIIFCRFSKKNRLGSVLFSRDGRVITNILLFLALLKCAKGELYFPLKNNYLYNLRYLAVLRTLNTHGGVILTLSFPDNIIFPEKLLLKLYPISLPTVKGMVYFKSKLTLPKINEYLLMSLVTHKEGDFFCYTCL